MKKKYVFGLFFILGLLVIVTIQDSYTRELKIHPSFKQLLIRYPRDKKIVRPIVPRISPKLALDLYRNNKAVFFAAGSKNQAIFPGVIRIDKPKKIENPPVNKLNAIKKMLVIYCH